MSLKIFSKNVVNFNKTLLVKNLKLFYNDVLTSNQIINSKQTQIFLLKSYNYYDTCIQYNDGIEKEMHWKQFEFIDDEQKYNLYNNALHGKHMSLLNELICAHTVCGIY